MISVNFKVTKINVYKLLFDVDERHLKHTVSYLNSIVSLSDENGVKRPRKIVSNILQLLHKTNCGVKFEY